MAGGIIRTPPHVGYNSRSERWAIVWGALSNAPYLNETKTGKRVCKIQVEITKSIKQGICVWEESSPETYNLMSQLERGDAILCLGTQVDGTYQNGKGEKVPNDVTASILIPQVVINAAFGMWTNPAIASLMDSAYSDEADGGDYQEDISQGAQPVVPADDVYDDFSAVDDIAGEVPFK